jgi:hypothetical protein
MRKCEELVRIVETLPADRVQEVLDFASFLAERAHKDDQEWEKRLNDPVPSKKISSMKQKLDAQIAAGSFKPLKEFPSE